MLLSSQVQRAINASAVGHDGQYRKSSDVPYVAHPFSVAFILSSHSDDENVVIAGLLHDLIEDVDGWTEDRMRTEFGDMVTDIVVGVSEPKTMAGGGVKIPWRERKESYLEVLRHGPRESLMVSAADKIHNLHTMLETYAQQGPDMLKAFNATPPEMKWFYSVVLELIQERLNSGLVEEYRSVYEEACTEIFNHYT